MGLFSREKGPLRRPGEWRRRPAGLPKSFERRQTTKDKGGFFARFMNPFSPGKKLEAKEGAAESFWSKKKYLTRPELRQELRRAPGKVPGFEKPFSKEEKIKMEEKEFPKEKYGLYIEPKEYEKWKRGKEKHPGQTFGEKLESKRKIQFWEELTKKKPAA